MDRMLSKLATKTAHETKDDADKVESPKETKLSASESFLCREFKISGQIGEPSHAEKLTFVSLTQSNRFRVKAPKAAKINSCEVDESKKSIDSNQQILAEIREMRMEVENLKRQQATRSDYVPKDNTTIGDHRKSRGSVDEDVKLAKKRKLGATCRHCFARGELGHIASECEKNIFRQNQGNGRTGISRRKESVPSVQRLQSSFGADFLAFFTKRNFPNVLVRDISELLVANGSSIPYKGWVELDLQIGDSEQGLSVGFLVASEEIELAITLGHVDLGDLNSEEIKAGTQLFIEDADVFAIDDNDVGCITELQMDNKLNDSTPVQKKHIALPRPLYPEVKAYIEDLLNKKLYSQIDFIL
ncbi:Hypothetical predicted protein [Paramuricea clavata]|uniref:Uncharacterized protein n=1 Tax=Paramuricea clavata TaxID=317549 RepID=A0A6S7GRG7_PARCT|nr:Hypothetical predicted protein [Paramuricea clavata]